ncbi:IS3 family transposase [Methylobacterium sp. PvR107]|uniref:IS3 family transposase n=1 Tax=Methylobacterium sp. PvR107 TaxID=2806597 RepID=UPI001B67FCBE|nr:IS3 family transposase [Methylobacterium sp. PvR107]MBP1178184.1 transposase InsO family protein [Methylobacterium sp. PvR107]
MLTMDVSERRACRALGQHRSTQRKVPRGRDDEEARTADLVALAEKYGRYGYRKISALLKAAGWFVNDKRVERIWRREGLKVPSRPSSPNEGGSGTTTAPASVFARNYRNHVWSYDFVEARTHDGRKIRMLDVVDAFTHACLAIRAARKLKAINVLSDLFILRGVPGHIRSDNGPEFVAKAVRAWITGVGAKTAYITSGSPWENGYVERFNARLRDELLNGEIFYTLTEAQVVIENWRRHDNTVRPHASLGYRPPAPDVYMPAFTAWRAALTRPTPPAKQSVVKRLDPWTTPWGPIRPLSQVGRTRHQHSAALVLDKRQDSFPA